MLYSVDLGLRNSLIVSYSKGCLNGSIGKKLASVPNLQLVEQEATVVPLLLHGLQLLAIERMIQRRKKRNGVRYERVCYNQDKRGPSGSKTLPCAMYKLMVPGSHCLQCGHVKSNRRR